VSAARSEHLFALHTPRPEALTSSYHLPLLLASAFILAAAVVAVRATNTRGQDKATPDTRHIESQSVTANNPESARVGGSR